VRASAVAVIAIVLSALALSAQQRPSSQADVARGLQNARQLLRDQKLDEANVAFHALVDAAHGLGLDAEEAQALCGLGQTFENQSRYKEAESALRHCLEIAERLHDDAVIARASLSLGQTVDVIGRTAEAVSLANRAIAVYDALQDPKGSASARLVLLRIQKTSLEEERTISGRIVEDARRAGDRGLEADALHDFGDALFNENRFEEALETLTRARNLNHELGRFGNEGTVLNSLGRVYRAHGRLDEALKCQQQALALHDKYGTPFELMQSHNAVAVVLEQMDDSAARDHYERALAIAKQSSSPRIQDFLNANIAGLLIDQGEYEKGARTLEEIIGRETDSYRSVRYGSLSHAYLGMKRYDDAVSAASQALATCGNQQSQCIGALGHRAAAYTAAGNYGAALADIHAALDTIEAMHARLVASDFLKQNFHEALQAVYSRGIALAFSQHDDRQSLETAELASSRAFLDLLAARQAAPPGRAPAGLTLRGSPSASDVASPLSATPAKADDLVAIARRLNSTIVVYWPADDALFTWVVKRDGRITSRKVDMPKARLAQLIRATAPITQEPDAQEPAVSHAVTTRGAAQLLPGDSATRRPWRQLYETLIAPIRAELPRTSGALLTIVPHGVLMNVSFAALQAHNGRYLLEDYALNYAPAGAVLQFTAGMRRADARKGTALLVADPVTAPRSPLDPQLPPLPGARVEVGRIARLISPARVTVLEGSDASEPRVTSTAAGKAIVHLATHAIVRDDAPNDSYLAFGPGGESTTGLLTSRDVYDLRLNADLVVLSACRSGGGPVTGDGVATFARAFIYAGTPSLVVSLWDVADEPTSRLLPAFYRSWLGGASKARSLRRAQLQLLADLRAGAVRVDTRAGPIVLPEHPMFWAGFILIGEPE
jgi:CHAT domain-containing protein/tetratricopeptide (TPR) repeat protein